MKIEYNLFIIVFILNCSFFPPQKINNDHILNLEEEIPGIFIGKKFFFNRYLEFMGFSNVEKECELKNESSILCKETFLLKNHEIKKIYCINFNYNNNDIEIDYYPECTKRKFLFSAFLKSYNKVRGAGFYILSYDSEPLNQMVFPISYYYTRSSKDKKFYFEEKHYYLFFWQIGKEITIWEKIHHE